MQTENALQDALSLMKQSYDQLRAYRDRDYRQQEPLAIVGMAGRFPGEGRDINAFWQMLLNGEDIVTEIPPERWDLEEYYDPNPEVIGKIYSRWGSFLKDIDQFDAAFFGISPQEAWAQDPQQRLLLESCWRAFENAGYLPGAEVDTGVFVGVCTSEYLVRLTKTPLEELDKRAIPYFSTGNVFNALSGRLSYVFGFQGPCVAMDTACSSSLVALHLACNAIRRGECKQAVVGGVNLQLIPESTMAISHARMLSPDGRCKTFDADANGYVRGEGCAVIIIKRLSEAIRDNDRIHAVIRGSAVNQDGGGSGFTVPSSKAQEKLMRKALASAGLEPGEVDYLEAHGTGTSLGDPIELSAVQAVYGAAARQRPLWVGSVKTNIGHLEAAAGITGVVKTAMSVKNRIIPAHLHLKNPNHRIPWSRYNIQVPQQQQQWPDVNRPARAAVSAFGFSGTNAHVILESAPEAKQETHAQERITPIDGYHFFSLSARSADALIEYAERHLAFPDTELPLNIFCKAVQRINPLMRYRKHFIVQTIEDLKQQLQQFLDLGPAALDEPANGREQYATAFIFNNNVDKEIPSFYKSLYERFETFAKAVDEYAGFIRKNKGTDILKLLDNNSAGPEWTIAAAHFVFQYALTALLREWTVLPDRVLGYGGGEYLAACVAGVMNGEDALRLLIASEEGKATTPEIASEMFANVLDYVALRTPIIPFISGTEGKEVKKELATREYWLAHATGKIDLDAAVKILHTVGGDKICLEFGTATVNTAKDSNHRFHTVQHYRSLLEILGDLYDSGFELDWNAFYEQVPVQVVDGLPGYPFQLKRYWPEEHNGNSKRADRRNKKQLLEYLYNAASWTEEERALIISVVNMLPEYQESRQPAQLSMTD